MPSNFRISNYMTNTVPLKVRGSASGFMWGRTVFTDYDGACLRKILVSSKGVRTEIDPIHGVRGKFNEDQYEAVLLKDGIEYKRELFTTDTIPGSIVPFQGSIDYLVSGPDCDEVHELKSTESKNKLRMIKAGQYSTENLAQCISYMISENTTVGKLIYTYFEPDDAAVYIEKYSRTFEIHIDNSGRIVVDSVPSKWTVHDQLLHRATSAKVVSEEIVWDRPHNWDLLWGSPCAYCPFKAACTEYDKGSIEGASAFIEYAKKCLNPSKESE